MMFTDLWEEIVNLIKEQDTSIKEQAGLKWNQVELLGGKKSKTSKLNSVDELNIRLIIVKGRSKELI